MNTRNKIEKSYIHCYKKYKKGEMSAARFREKVKEMHFNTVDGVHMRLAENAAWYMYENGRWIFNSYMKGERNRRRLNVLAGFKKRHTAIKIISFVVIAALFMSFVYPGFLTSSYSRVAGENSVYHSPKVVKELYDTVTVRAPKGALLREDQEFEAYELSDEKIYQLTQEYKSEIIPLYGFEFDAGLGSDEAFRKDVTIEVDLEKTDIPKDSYKYLGAYRLSESGTERIVSTVDGSTMKISASKNSVTLVGIAMWTGIATLVGLIGNEAIHNSAFYGGVLAPYSDYTVYKIPGNKYNGYTIYYHDDLSPADIKSLKKREQEVMRKYGFIWDYNISKYIFDSTLAQSNDPAKELKRVSFDPAFKKIQDEKSKLPIPDALKILSERIKDAHDYLVGQCGLTNPGTVNFIVLAEWNDVPGTLATESKVTGRNPVIKINPKIIKLANLPSAVKKEQLDDLLVTLTHEMFHAIQHRYYSNTIENLWFAEATAVTLEKDCAEYFRKKGLISTYTPVDTNYYHLLRHGTSKSISESVNTHIGYTLSNVLMFHRDNMLNYIFTIRKDNYLHTLMTQFAKDNNCNAIYNMNRSNNILTEYFKARYKEVLSDNRELISVTVDKSKVPVKIAHIGDESLIKVPPYEKSFSISRFDVDVSIPNMSANELKASALMLVVKVGKWTSLLSNNIKILSSPDTTKPKADRTWTEPPDKSGICPVDAKNISNGLIVFVLNEKYDILRPSTDISALVAPKPQKANSVKYNKDMLGFDVELPPENTISGSLKRGRVVEVSVPGTSIEKYRKYVEPGKDKVFIPILEMLSQDRVKSSFFPKWAGRLLSAAMNTSFKMLVSTAKTQINKMAGSVNSEFMNILEFGEDPISIGINESYNYTDDDGFKINLAHELRKQGFPTSFSYDAYSKDDLLKLRVEGDNGLFLDYSAKLTDYFKYFRFLRLNPKAGIDYDALAKKVHEMDNTDVVFKVRDVYSLDNVTSIEKAVAYEDSFGKTNDIILGPESDDITLLTSGISFDRKSLPEGTYGGKFLFDIENNIADVITHQRMQYKDIRMKEEIERETERYIRNNNPTPEELEKKKMQIKADVINAELEFEVNFGNSMGEFNYFLKHMYYYLTIESQTKATLSMKGSKKILECSIQPTGKRGVYMMTLKDPENPVTAKLVIMPNGEIVTEGALAILKR